MKVVGKALPLWVQMLVGFIKQSKQSIVTRNAVLKTSQKQNVLLSLEKKYSFFFHKL